MILIIFTRYISYITRSIFLIFVCIKIIKKDTLNIFLLGFQHYQIGPNDMLVLRFSIEIHLENYYIIFLTYNYYILMLYILLMAHPSISTSNSSLTQSRTPEKPWIAHPSKFLYCSLQRKLWPSIAAFPSTEEDYTPTESNKTTHTIA